MPSEERKSQRFRRAGGDNVRPRTSLTQYRVLHGPMIRRYYSIGDPLRDRTAAANLAKLFLIFLMVGGLLALVILVVKRMSS